MQVSFRNRRRIALVVTSIAIIIAAAVTWLQSGRLGDTARMTGLTLLCCLLLLMLLGVRRRLPVLPLGTVSMWTQIHLYLGLFTTAVYLLHVPALVAGGPLEFGLSLVFLVVTISGVYGIYASRTLPKRLTAVFGEPRFDRVGWHRDQIAETARGLISELHQPSAIGVLDTFYRRELRSFFDTRPSLAYVCVPTGLRRRRLLSGLQELDRYLESDGRGVAGRFAALVRRRDDLDYQFALQLRLRVWVVVHSLFSVALIVGAIVHAVLAWRFSG